ncbi:MAG TPA: DUF4160 domain-containing protein [Steroidobacteraceae bacterium]|jgi:hypothetical protein|nr:DUF4160 domain-containing protein [Steroidobacteraceae bacterium]
MPTILRIAGARVIIYPNDHWPEHVHIKAAEREVVIELNCPDGPVAVRENYGFSGLQLGRLKEQLAEVLMELCAAWEEIHEG